MPITVTDVDQPTVPNISGSGEARAPVSAPLFEAAFPDTKTPAMIRTHLETAPCPPDTDEQIHLHGVRVHNLRDFDLSIPRDRLVIVTGPSGSGKSSLAFDTIYAEGQRQFIESLSIYARQFLQQLERPDVDLIEGLPPTIAIDQRAGLNNPRSTVATVTELYDCLRLLYARLGDVSCYRCGQPIRRQTPEEIRDALVRMGEGTRVMLLAPVLRGRKGEHHRVVAAIRKWGFPRARIDGEVIDVDNAPPLAKGKRHDVEAVIDRVIIRPGIEKRLTESITTALRYGNDVLIACCEVSDEEGQTRWQDLLFSGRHACPQCGINYEELEPRTFSFSSPYGACPHCEGLGRFDQFDPDLVCPDLGKSLAESPFVPGKLVQKLLRDYEEQLRRLMEAGKFDEHTPLAELQPKARKALFFGHSKYFVGVLPLLEQVLSTTTARQTRRMLEGLRAELPCPECGGTRLRPEARTVYVHGKTITETTQQSVTAAIQFFDRLEFPAERQPIARPLIHEITGRLRFLEQVGLGYLTLDRAADTLSGGELQRVRLASGLGSGLVGVCYILDEPSIGLHPRDNQRLIDAIRTLQQRGNTVLVVEHDEAVMRAADWLIDLGPGAGESGGHVVAQGTLEDVIETPQSPTGRYLAGSTRIPVPKQRRRAAKTRSLVLEGVTTNNLKDVTVGFPLGTLVCVTGVSGAGKSSLVSETLVRAVHRRLHGAGAKPGPYRALRGVNRIDKLVEIDQSPIGRSPRSNPATYTGVFDEIRKVFAGTREARRLGFKSGRFSFNNKGGRCEACQGQGQQKIEMNFLPDLYVTCPVCDGRRFNEQTLQIRYRDRSIADVLEMSVDDAATFFENFSAVVRVLESLQEVGLGYLRLGQPSNTLSGGEAQRVKLANELSRVDTGKTLYVLDEPTTGLHFDDISKLLEVLNRLVDRGNTVIVVEHHLDVLKTADWLIDLGPEGGEAGGHVLACGRPEEIAAMENHTGRFLRRVLGN